MCAISTVLINRYILIFRYAINWLSMFSTRLLFHHRHGNVTISHDDSCCAMVNSPHIAHFILLSSISSGAQWNRLEIFRFTEQSTQLDELATAMSKKYAHHREKSKKQIGKWNTTCVTLFDSLHIISCWNCIITFNRMMALCFLDNYCIYCRLKRVV